MPSMDIFRGDAFSLQSLTDAILKVPFKPGRLGQLGIFRDKPITTTTVSIEEKEGQLELIQSSERGGVVPTMGAQKRKVRSFVIPHLALESKIRADEIQNVRAFGTESEEQLVQAVVDERLADLRASHEVTLEHLRMGALKGLILDADGSTIYNLFTEFDVAQQTKDITPTSAADEGDALRGELRAAMRLIETELGDTSMVSGFRAFVGATMFDAIVGDLGVVQTLRQADATGLTRTEAGRRVFEFGGVIFEEYTASTGGTAWIDPAEGYLFPIGPDIFRTYYAPGDFTDTVNTRGLPLYARTAMDPEFQRWVKLHTQSNPLALCLRPRAVVKLT